jgi:hypothetical protein
MNASQDTDDEALWFGRQIEAVFGTGSQSTFSRFLKAAADDHRLHKTILRSIHNAATGHHRVSIEMKVLLRLLQNPHRIQDLIGGLQEPCSPGNTSVVPVGRVGADACSSTQTAGEGTMHGACRFEHPCDDEPSSPGLC